MSVTCQDSCTKNSSSGLAWLASHPAQQTEGLEARTQSGLYQHIATCKSHGMPWCVSPVSYRCSFVKLQ